MMLGVVAGVGQENVEAMASVGRADQTMELQVVRLGPAVDDHAEEQVGLDVANGRELGITPFVVGLMTMTSLRVIARDVTRLQPGRVDRHQLAGLIDQAAPAGEGDAGVKKSASAPFFSNRRSA